MSLQEVVEHIKNGRYGSWSDGSAVENICSYSTVGSRGPAPMVSNSQPPVMPAAGDLTPSSGLLCYSHMGAIYSHRHNHEHMNKNKFEILK